LPEKRQGAISGEKNFSLRGENNKAGIIQHPPAEITTSQGDTSGGSSPPRVASVQAAEHSGDDGYVPQDRAGEILKRLGFQPKPDQGEPKAKPRCNATTSLLRQELAKCRLTPEERALVDAELDTMRKRKPNLVGGALH